MERLTKYGNTVHKNKVCCTHFKGPECIERSGYCTDDCPWEEAAWSRLAAYEDTGLEPEGVEAMKNAMMGKSIAEITEFEGIPIDRLRELAQADREERCVVLPCKVEDDVYINILGRTFPFTVISISQMASTPTFKAQHGIRLVYIFKADDVGETVFLTRAEAEEALRREQA